MANYKYKIDKANFLSHFTLKPLIDKLVGILTNKF